MPPNKALELTGRRPEACEVFQPPSAGLEVGSPAAGGRGVVVSRAAGSSMPIR
jgi:hypothetical protein